MISATELTALLIAVTGLVAALGVLYSQIRSLSKRVDGRLTELLNLTRESSRAEGLLAASVSDQTTSARMPEFGPAEHAQRHGPPTNGP